MPMFIFWMLFASGLGLLKVLVLARVLAPSDFGNYASLAGGALLSSTLLSFGLIEMTTKLYPRLWVTGEQGAIRRHAGRLAVTMTLRYALVAVIIGAVAATADIGYGPLTYIAGAVLGLGTTMLGIVAAVVRATGSAKMFQHFSLTRAAAAFVAACAGGWLWQWHGAIIGEALAALATLAIAGRTVLPHFPRTGSVIIPAASDGGGRTLYFANLLSSSTGLADRGFVNAALGPAVAGAYGVVALLFQVGQLVANIIAQRVGPHVIKLVHGGDRQAAGFRALRLPILGMLLVSVAVSVTMLGMNRLGLADGMLQSYGLTSSSIVMGGLIAFFQIFVVLEFLLVARDAEKAVFTASAISTLLFFGLFTVAALLDLSLEWFLAFVLLARASHVLILSVFVHRAINLDLRN